MTLETKETTAKVVIKTSNDERTKNDVTDCKVSKSSSSTYNPLTHATSVFGIIKNVIVVSRTQENNATIEKSNSPVPKSISTTTATSAVDSACGSYRTPAGDDERKVSAEDASESITSKFSPVKYAGSAVGVVKSAFGYFGTSVEDVNNKASAENTSESTISKYNPIKYAGLAVDVVKSAFGYFGTSVEDGENKASAENASESTISKYNPIRNVSTSIGDIKRTFGSVETPAEDKEVKPSAENASVPSISKFRSSSILTGNIRISSPETPVFAFDIRSFSKYSLMDLMVNGDFPTFGASVSGTLIATYFAANEGLFSGSKKMQNQETQTEEDVSQNYDVSSIWRMLECPVCFEIILPPVYQCKEGHNACQTCWSKVKMCPLCRRPRSRKRNYLAQSLIEEIPLPCKYRAEGCLETLQYNNKLDHEGRCTFRIIYQCPIDPLCNQIYGYKNMCTHLKDHHMNVYHFDDHVGERESFCTDIFKESQNIVHSFHIKQWGLFFLQKASVGDLTGCFMQVIPATTNQPNFDYSLDVCDHYETRKEYYRGCVLPLENCVEEIINAGKYLTLSDLILETIKDESPLKIVVRIWKKIV